MKPVSVMQGLLGLALITEIYVSANDISKRATDNEELYIFAERDSPCVTVKSIEPCSATWKLSPFAAKFYNFHTKLTSTLLNGLNLTGANGKCMNAAKTTWCGQAAPRCFEDGSQDYGDVKNACPTIYSECPESVAEMFKAQGLCEKVLSGKMAKPKCVTAPKITGNCPQPKYKMPNDALSLYMRTAQDNQTIQTLGQLNSSVDCQSEMEKQQCMPVYCSKDEKYLLVEFVKADCDNAIKQCAIDPLNAQVEALKKIPLVGNSTAELLSQSLKPTIDSFKEACAVYPVDPQKYKTTDVGAASTQLTDCVVLLFSFVVGRLLA